MYEEARARRSKIMGYTRKQEQEGVEIGNLVGFRSSNRGRRRKQEQEGVELGGIEGSRSRNRGKDRALKLQAAVTSCKSMCLLIWAAPIL